jgi:hypothetical protein
MRKTKFVLPLLLLLGLAVVSGCAKPPQEAIDTARQALESARAAGAADYAPQALKSAEDAVAQLDAELQAQQKKFALFRSYKNLTTMAESAKTAGETAVAEANTGKERARGEAEAAIAQARTALTEAQSLLSTAPAGKGSQMDIEAMKNDLMGVETSVAEADRAYQEGRFLEAKSKADAANAQAMSVKTAVDQAKQMRAGKGRM